MNTDLRCSMQAPATTSPELVFPGKSTAPSETRPYPLIGRAGSPSRPWLCSRAFTLVELLIVIAIIGVIAAMVISSYSNAAQDTRNVVVLQQQAEVQGALNNWVAAQSSLSKARTAYAGLNNIQRFDKIHGYLDDSTLSQFGTKTSEGAWDWSGSVDANGHVVSDVMEKVGQSIYFPDWADGSYPQVILEK